MDQDRDHLRLLTIFHYVMGGLMMLVGCFPTIHLSLGILMVSGVMDEAMKDADGPPPEAIGWIFISVAAFIIVIAWAMGIAVILAGRKLAKRTSYTFCFVVACIECVFMPIGTALGVFTILVLMRPSVKALFGMPADNGPASPGDGGT